MTLGIHGLGLATPSTIVNQEEIVLCVNALARYCPTSSRRPALYADIGIKNRHLVLPRAFVDDLVNDTRSSDSVFLPDPNHPLGPTTGQRMAVYAQEAGCLAECASKHALADAALEAEAITHLITVSCTGFAAPNFDIHLMNSLGMRPTVERVHIGFMGCHAALNGLRVANAFATSDSKARVLLCALETCSVHFHYGDVKDKQIANSIFSDGAAAVVGWFDSSPTGMINRASAIHAPRESDSSSDAAPKPQFHLLASGSCLMPESTEEMKWTIGDHGFEMTLSRNVPDLIRTHLRPYLEDWLSGHGLLLKDVAAWAVHPGGPKILDAVEIALNLPRDALQLSRAVFAEHGNMSSPTILFVLDRFRQRTFPSPCVALGFGPGLVVEAALLA
jgi:predicted naringenin-chalcone synthase